MKRLRDLSIVSFCVVAGLDATSAADGQSTLIPAGSVWKYEATGTDLGTAWRELGYDDGAWPSGPAQLGYGDGDEATTLPSSPVGPCYYFRHTFSVENPEAFASLTLGSFATTAPSPA